MDKEQTDLNSSKNAPSPGDVRGDELAPSLEQESLESVDSLEQPQSLEDAPPAGAATGQNPDPGSSNNDSKPPLYEVSQASPSPAPSSNHSLFSNSGKYSFVGKSSHRKIALIFLGVLTVLLIIAGAAAFMQSGRSDEDTTPSLSEQEVTSIPTTDLLSVDSPSLESADKIHINGPLQVEDQFILTPSDRPEDAQTGQIYFDNNDRSFVYFDGTAYRTLTTADQIMQAQQILNGELTATVAEQNEYIDNVVRSLQNATGRVNLSAGSGIAISGLEITNRGVTSLQGTPNQVLVSASTGAVTISLPQDIHSGATPTFSGLNLQQLDVAGIATVTTLQADMLTLTQPLDITSGGTGSITSDFDPYGVVYYDGTRLVSTEAAVAAGMCFMSTTGAPRFQPCDTIDFDLVKSLNGLTGSLTLANADATGPNTLKIRDASYTESGLLTATDQNIAGLKTFSGGINIKNGATIGSDGSYTLQPANNYDLTIATSGSGNIILSNLNCSAMGNGGKLTVNASGILMCGEDTGGDGVGLVSIQASDASIAIDITDGASPAIAVNTRAGGGLSVGADGLGLSGACTDGQILKYDGSTSNWYCANDIGEENPVAECPTCVALQEDTPGTAQTGHVNITGTIRSGNSHTSGVSYVGGEFITNGRALIQSSTDSENAFQVQNAVGASLINSDTSHMSVTIGSLASPATPKIGGSLPPAPIGSIGTGTNGSPSGTNEPKAVAIRGNYAYTAIGTRNVVQIADISDPENPEFVTELGIGANSNPSDVAVYGDYLYVLARGTSLLRVYDISEDPLLTTNAANVAIQGATESMALYNNYLFITSANARLQIIDLSNPANPTVKYTVITASGADGVAVKDNHAYVTQWGDNRIQIFDISDLQNSAPTSVGTVATNGGPRRISISGDYAYVVNSTAGNMQTFDLSNPASPVAVDSVATGAHPYSVHATGDVALVATYSGKTLQVFTLSNPADPTSVGSIPTSRNAIYVTYAQGYAFVTGANNGLSGILEIFSLGGSSETLTVYGNTSVVGRLTATSAEFGGNVAVGSLIANSTVTANTAVYTPHVDTLSTGTLQLGANNATAINLNQNTTIGVGKTLTVQGETTITADATNALLISDGGNNSYLHVDTSTKNISIGSISAPSGGDSGGGDLPTSHTSSTNVGGIFPLAVETDGNYAYAVGMLNFGLNLIVLDISDPHNPVNVGGAPTSAFVGSFPTVLAVENGYAYVVANNNLDIFDVRNPSAPTRVSNHSVQGAGSAYGVDVSGNYAYVVYKNASDQAYINVVNVSNKSAPSTVHSQYLGASTSELYIDIDGTYAYIAKKGTGALFSEIIVLDISNPTGGNLPLKRLALSGNAVGAMPEAIVAKNGYAYVPLSDARAMQIFDATDHNNPPVARGTTPISDTPMNIAISDSGTFVYLTDSIANTLRLINVANPDNPANIGTVAAGSQTEGVAVSGGAVYVASRGDNTVRSYDFGSGSQAASISLNQNTLLASGKTFTAQGDTLFKTDSESALLIQNAAGDNLMTVDTINNQITMSGDLSIQTDSATAFDIQTSAGTSILTVDTTNSTLTVAGDSVFQGNITVSGHVITAGEAPNAAIQVAAGVGATCVVTGNDSSGTITITAGSDSLSEGDTCVLTFSKPYAGTPRPLVSPLNKSSAEAGPYASADSTTLTLSFAQAPVAGQTYSFNYWNVQ